MTSTVITREAIKSFVYDALVDFGVRRSSLSADAALDDLEIDSLDMVELGQAVKKHFAVQVRPKDFEEVNTVGDALDVIYKKAGL